MMTKSININMWKTLLFIYVIILPNAKVFSQNFWEKIDSPTTKLLNSIMFIDSLNGWVAGDSGLIIHTSDGGLNWETQHTNDSLNVVNIFFLNNQLGWGSAWSSFYEPYGTYLLKTTNGGKNWSSEYFRISNTLVNAFYFLDSFTGFAIGYPQVFHKTTDGGLSWFPVNLDSSIVSGLPPYTIEFYSPLYGFACGGIRDVRGVVWRTTDGGLNWSTVVDSLTTEPLYDLHIFDSLNVISMGGDPEFGTSQVVTTNGGETWEYKALGIFYYPYSVDFRNSTEGWVPMGEQRKFLYTTDSGLNWIKLSTPDSINIAKITFSDSIHGYGIGPYGNLAKYSYQQPTNLVEVEKSISNFNLLQNYPNPFNPTTTIKYSLANKGYVKLAVYNILGEQIATLVNATQNAGWYEVIFNGSAFSSGVYIYKIEVGNLVSARKLLLLK
jgi:photosystem II stability/assembly factor-like uncharacterized protein